MRKLALVFMVMWSTCFGEVVIIKNTYNNNCLNLFSEAVEKAMNLERMQQNKEFRKFVDNYKEYDIISDLGVKACVENDMLVLADELDEYNEFYRLIYLEQVGRIGRWIM